MAAPMSPLIFSFPVMYAVVGFCSPATIFANVSLDVEMVASASPPPPVTVTAPPPARAPPPAGRAGEPGAAPRDGEEIGVAPAGDLRRLGPRLERLEEFP